MKEKWLRTLRTEWLIMGHLDQTEAIEIVTRSERLLKCRSLDPDQIPSTRLVKLPALSVHEYEELNHDATNPNSAVVSQF